MRRNQDSFEPSHDSDRQRPISGNDEIDDRDLEIGVAHRLPLREADEEEIAEEDIMEQRDDEDAERA